MMLPCLCHATVDAMNRIRYEADLRIQIVWWRMTRHHRSKRLTWGGVSVR
jgi:hypothetical protein